MHGGQRTRTTTARSIGATGPLLAAMVLVATPMGLSAQATAPDPGARVRITVPCSLVPTSGSGADGETCRSKGTLSKISADTLVLAHDGTTERYGLDAVRRLEVSRGRSSRWLVGSIVGFGVGTGTTGAVLYSGGSTSLCDRSANQDAMAPGECLGLSALGGLAGAGLGALVGSLVRSEDWRDAPLGRPTVTLDVAPAPGRTIGLAVTVGGFP